MHHKLLYTLKSTLEFISFYKIWAEPPSELNEVRSFISSLKPVAISCPLVRLGAEGDGGYLVPDDLDGIDSAVSPGVSNEISFDLAMAGRGIDVYMNDASVDKVPIEDPKLHFQKKHLDVIEDKNNTRLDTVCSAINDKHNGDRILQMDIEGAEYRVLLDASEKTLKSFRMMLIEFHHLDRVFAKFPLRIIRATFQKLLRTHHIVHIHPNNVVTPISRNDLVVPPVMEFTFYRKNRATLQPRKSLKFPNALDFDNTPNRPPLHLPACWQPRPLKE